MASTEDILIKINVFMDVKFRDKIDWLSEHYEKEVGGFILGRINEDGIFMEDLLLPKQEVGHGSVDFDKKDLIDMREQNKEACNKIIGEWHSHNKMGCFWSSTDNELIEQFCVGRDASVFIVSSKRAHLIRFELRKPVKLSLNKLSYGVINSSLEQELKKEIEEKIKKEEPTINKKISSWAPSSYSEFYEQPLIPIGSAEINSENIYGNNVLRINKKVRVFGIEGALREAIEEEFDGNKPKKIGKGGQDLLFSFHTSRDAIDFYNEMCDFIFNFKMAPEEPTEDDLSEQPSISEIIQEGFEDEPPREH